VQTTNREATTGSVCRRRIVARNDLGTVFL
jgi:hypothetical protein